MQDLSLAKLDEVLLAIEAATTVQEIKSTIDAAIAIGVYTKQAKLGKDIELRAAEYILRAERKLGEMLTAAKAAGQIGHGSKSTGENQYTRGVVPKENNTSFTLDQAGIDRKLSSKAQKLAAIPKGDFEEKVAEGKESGKLTSNTVMKPAQSNGEKSNAETSPKQLDRIYRAMADGEWRTLDEIAAMTGDPTTSISAQLRHLRKPKFGEHVIEKARHNDAAGGLFVYRLKVSDENGDNDSTPDVVRREPKISRGELSLTAQQKFDLAVKQEKHRLGITFREAVQAEVNRRIRDYLEELTPRLKAEQEEAQRIIKARKGIMTTKAYKKILACLHPDRAMHPARDTDEGLRKAYEEAFHIFSRLERLVLDERACPTPVDSKSAPMPNTPEEWEAAARKTTETRRKAKKGTDRSMSRTNGTGRVQL
jgi:hypothetical protein